ncbi:hypothetical protein [Sphingobium fuliginis]|uniref:Lipoprotein n=1 Tax=Sphingobium fuliginis (strain ATCC 27551) TaxID=336203 RepID=A0ABQ1ET47_SPHSA|nr:hypothetical protein [Sphingobium fuliginis]RYL99635.1 hypothetical protein EWH10_07195 [Sphingobium fuliginis]GFZ86159.1 hypothetical protein GCM10019071_14410 [Sphingobium fuliginis]
MKQWKYLAIATLLLTGCSSGGTDTAANSAATEEMPANELADTAADATTADVAAETANWVLQRASMSGACHVKLEPAKPELGAVIAKKPTRAEICAEAKARHADDAADTGKCFAYTAGAIAECAKEKITLP